MDASDVNNIAQVIISIMPIVGIVIGGTCLFFFMLWHHHEVKLQIKTGMFVPVKTDYRAVSLLTGLLLTVVGAIMSLVFGLLAGASYLLLGGLIPFATGASILLFYILYPPFHEGHKKKKDDDDVQLSDKDP